jgi:predicted ester cyclase
MIRQYYADIFAHGNLNALELYVAPSCIIEMQGSAPGHAPGLALLKERLARFWVALPVVEHTILDLISQDDKVVTRWAMRVRHASNYEGIPATGRVASLTGVDIFRLADQKIVKQWTDVGHESFLKQLKHTNQIAQPHRAAEQPGDAD